MPPVKHGQEATYLLAGVEVVATYKLKNVNRVRMENLFHKIFSSAQIDISIDDRFGNPVKPREWSSFPCRSLMKPCSAFWMALSPTSPTTPKKASQVNLD